MEWSKVAREKAIEELRQIATREPEDTRGDLKAQISASKAMYCLGYELATQRLTQLAKIEAGRSKEVLGDQEAQQHC